MTVAVDPVAPADPAGSTVLRWAFLGRVDYDEALGLQLRLRDDLLAGRRDDETLLLLEHPAVITLGRSANPANIVASEAELGRLGIDRRQVERGGDVTYHGPGQLVGYPVRRVGRGLHAHVKAMADALVALLAEHEISAWWNDSEPGVWTEAGKIGAVGVDARGGVAVHGFALNVNPKLEHFLSIIPCGLDKPVTSMAALGVCPTPSVEDIARRLAPLLAAGFHRQPLQFTPADLLRGTRNG